MTGLYLRVAPCILIALMACSSPPRKTGDYKIALVSVRRVHTIADNKDGKIKPGDGEMRRQYVTGQEGIFVMNSDATGKKLAFQSSNAQLFPFSWSPDGKKIALLLARKENEEDKNILTKYQIPYHFPLYELDLASGKEKRLLNIPVSSFRWSPDGRYMLYLSSYEDPGQAKSAIYLLNLQTGEQKRLTPLTQNCSGAFSPDGTQLAYSLGTDEASDVYTMSLDGNNPRCLTDSKSTKSINIKPAWSPDGKNIAYISANPSSEQNAAAGIYITDPTGAEKRLVSSMLAFSVTWSPDGKSLLIQWEGGLSVMDVDGKKTKNIITGIGRPLDAVFAPDGKKIVLRSIDLKLYSVDLDGTHLRAITHITGTSTDMAVTSFCLSPLQSKP
jgi:Tol biopolymer transport system component